MSCREIQHQWVSYHLFYEYEQQHNWCFDECFPLFLSFCKWLWHDDEDKEALKQGERGCFCLWSLEKSS